MNTINNPYVEIIGKIVSSDLKNLKFGGYRAILTGAKLPPMILLYQLLLKLDFTEPLV